MKKIINGLAFKFSLGTALITVILFTIYGVMDYQTKSSDLYKQLDERISLSVNNLTGTLSTALWNFETETMETALESAAQTRDISAIAVIDDSGLVAAYEKIDGEVIAIVDIEEIEGFIDYPLTVIEDGAETTLGTLKLTKSTDYIVSQLSSLVVEQVFKTLFLAILLVTTIVVLMRILVSQPINQVVVALKDISKGDGDLTKRLPENSKDEIGILARYFNRFVERIHNMVIDVSESTNSLTGAVDTLQKIVDSNSDRVEVQQQETDAVATAINEMSSSASEVASSAERAANSATEADKQANKAINVVQETGKAVELLAEEFSQGTESINTVQNSVDEIGSVLDVIRGIAEQTNLLALNAAIEAARAGEQGRGFAVVADEVRALAGRTQQSTGEIQEMIARLQSGAGAAVEVMAKGAETSNKTVSMANEAVEDISVIAEHVSSVTEMNRQIASSVGDQSHVAQTVNDNIARITDLAQETSDVSKKALSTSEVVSSSSQRLKELVSSFKV